MSDVQIFLLSGVFLTALVQLIIILIEKIKK